MGSTALGFWRAALNDGVVKCFSNSSRIRRCIPKGTARPASQRFNVEYVTQRNRANSSCEVPIALLIFRTWLGVILGILTPRTLRFQSLCQYDLRKAAPRADR